MNPFTQSLLKQVKDRALVEFVTQWDALEALVIHVYKGGVATSQDEAEHARLRGRLRRDHSRWQVALGSYWPRTRAGGEPMQEDPFVRLLAVARAADFVDNWAAMQVLPAARESLNMWLMDVIDT
jgi:hypothetical protein